MVETWKQELNTACWFAPHDFLSLPSYDTPPAQE